MPKQYSPFGGNTRVKLWRFVKPSRRAVAS